MAVSGPWRAELGHRQEVVAPMKPEKGFDTSLAGPSHALPVFSNKVRNAVAHKPPGWLP